jgi:hypothetical protein
MLCTSLAENRRVCAGFQQIVNKADTLQGLVFVSIRRRDPITGFRVQGFAFVSMRRGDPTTGFRVQGFARILHLSLHSELSQKLLQLCQHY